MKQVHLPEQDRSPVQVLIVVGVGAPAREGTPMLKVVQEEVEANENEAGVGGASLLDEIVRDGGPADARGGVAGRGRCLHRGPRRRGRRDGRRLVVRNGYHRVEREVRPPPRGDSEGARVNDKRIDAALVSGAGSPRRSCRAWARRSPRVAEVLPLLYLHGMSLSDFGPALTQFLGTGAGLSAATITRLTAQWQDEAAAFNNAILGRHRLRLHVGRRDPPQGPPGAGQGVSASDDRGPGRRHQGADRSRRWTTASRPSRGPTCSARVSAEGCSAPVLAVGDGALGFWAAVREVFPDDPGAALLVPQDRQRACNALPKSVQPDAKAALARDLERRGPRARHGGSQAFETTYATKWPKATAKITDDLDVLLEFYDYPAEHWVHLRTTNPIESTFATVRLRPTRHQGTRLESRRGRDGVQAHRGRPEQVARGERTPPCRPRPRRRRVQERHTRRTTRRTRPRTRRQPGSRVTHPSTGLDYSSERHNPNW